MKVLMINTVCGTGSTGRICTDIANILKERGGDCLICYGRGSGIGFDNTYKIGYKISVNLHALKTRITDKHGLGSKFDTKKLIKKIQEYDPDIIHLHNIHGYYLNYKMLFEFLANYNKPIVWTLHDFWPFTGHCAYFDFIQCDKWKNLCNKCQLKNDYPASKLISSAKHNFLQKKASFTSVKNMTIVTPSNWLKRLIKQSFLSSYPVAVINNGIDTNVFKHTESNLREVFGLNNKFIILAVANIWNARKGIDDIIKLADLLDDNEVIVIVGKVLNEVNHKKILFIERTSDVWELAKLYTIADVVINPTYEDNYPTINLEAQACGTPVITYATGGSVESVVSDNIVEKSDYKALYKKIKTMNNSINKIKDRVEMVNDYLILYENYSNCGKIL